jgi:hypothetical protein
VRLPNSSTSPGWYDVVRHSGWFSSASARIIPGPSDALTGSTPSRGEPATSKSIPNAFSTSIVGSFANACV